jgi:hypothetical protein
MDSVTLHQPWLLGMITQKNIYMFNIGYLKTKKQAFNVAMFSLYKYYFCILNRNTPYLC